MGWVTVFTAPTPLSVTLFTTYPSLVSPPLLLKLRHQLAKNRTQQKLKDSQKENALNAVRHVPLGPSVLWRRLDPSTSLSLVESVILTAQQRHQNANMLLEWGGCISSDKNSGKYFRAGLWPQKDQCPIIAEGIQVQTLVLFTPDSTTCSSVSLRKLLNCSKS